MFAFVIGAVSGLAQFMMLSVFTKAITGGTFNSKVVLLGVVQFFIPLLVMLGCALWSRDSLLLTGIGMAFSLLICAFVRFITANRKSGGR